MQVSAFDFKLPHVSVCNPLPVHAMEVKSKLSFSCRATMSQDPYNSDNSSLMFSKFFLYEASPPFATLLPHINTEACPGSSSCGTAALSGRAPQVTTADNQTRTHA